MLKTVFNKTKFNHMDQPLFLGEQTGLQRFDSMKYPIFMKQRKDQMEQMWEPEATPLALDRNQFDEMPEEERTVFLRNLSWQTATDSMLSSSHIRDQGLRV